MIWQYFGLNVGNDINFGGANFDTDVIDRDCDHLVNSVGINYFRANAKYSNATGITQIRYIVQKLLSLGANVQYGVSFEGVGANPTLRATAEGVMQTEAAWFQSLGGQRFQGPNELELNIGGGVSEADVYTYQQTLPALMTSAGFTGQKSITVSQDHYSQWTGSGKGNYDDVGLDIYGGDTTPYGLATFSNYASQCNTVIAALGADCYLAEWAAHPSEGDLDRIDPEEYAKEMMKRHTFNKANFSRPCYMHCWRFNGTDLRDFWAAKKDSGETRLFWFDVIEQRRKVYQ